MSSIGEQVIDYLKRFEIPLRSRVLIAFSGGPDSTALLHALHGLQSRFPLWLACAYLDHGLRPVQEVEEEIMSIRRRCTGLGVPLELGRLPRGYLQSLAKRESRSLEEVARQERYGFLMKKARRYAADFIALGHHSDDQVETQIMRFFQGADVSGLVGILPRRGEIIRPLYYCTRREILSYLKEHGLSYSIDSTNRNRRMLRNSVRQNLVPVVERLFPGFRRSLVDMAERMGRLQAFLDQEADERLPWREEPPAGNERGPERFRITGEIFLKAPEPLRSLSVLRLIDRLHPGLRRVPRRFVSCLGRNNYIRNRSIILSGYGIRLYWKRKELFLERDVVGISKKGYLIVVEKDREYTIPKVGLRIIATEPERSVADAIEVRVEKGPILIRSRRPGERLKVEGGSKSLKKLFSEWEVPKQERWKIPIVVDRGGVVAILGQPFGFPNRFRTITNSVEHLRTLRLTVEPLSI